MAHASIGWTNSDQPTRICKSRGKVEKSQSAGSHWPIRADWCTEAGPPCWHRPGGREAAKAVLGSQQQKVRILFLAEFAEGSLRAFAETLRQIG